MTGSPDEWPHGVGRPDDLPLVLRTAVRVVVRDADGSVLLLHTRDVLRPEAGLWWELPGGGLDPGESMVDAAVRELREETGFVVDPAAVGPPLWRRTASFRHRRRRHLQSETVVAVTVPGRAPALDTSGRFDYENEDYIDFRWWAVEAISASRDRFYPGRLPRLLADFLAGRQIDEPFELFS